MKNGFTLIELLVVVLIIGILAAVALPQYENAVLKSRTVEARVLGSALQKAQEVYFLANGSYAPVLEDLDIEMPKKTYFNFSTVNGDIFAGHPVKPLFFEFNTATSGWKGAQWCGASAADDKLNNLCKSFGFALDHTGNNTNYYKLN